MDDANLGVLQTLAQEFMSDNVATETRTEKSSSSSSSSISSSDMAIVHNATAASAQAQQQPLYSSNNDSMSTSIIPTTTTTAQQQQQQQQQQSDIHHHHPLQQHQFPSFETGSASGWHPSLVQNQHLEQQHLNGQEHSINNNNNGDLSFTSAIEKRSPPLYGDDPSTLTYVNNGASTTMNPSPPSGVSANAQDVDDAEQQQGSSSSRLTAVGGDQNLTETSPMVNERIAVDSDGQLGTGSEKSSGWAGDSDDANSDDSVDDLVNKLADSLLDELIIASVLSTHRAEKLGILFREQPYAAPGFSADAIVVPAVSGGGSSKKRSRLLYGSRPVVRPTPMCPTEECLTAVGRSDVFGEPIVISSKAAKQQQQQECCPCPQCDRSLAAVRFAPHLEKCMGMGRNSYRVASRRLAAATSRNPAPSSATSSAPTLGASSSSVSVAGLDEEDSDDPGSGGEDFRMDVGDDDDDWCLGGSHGGGGGGGRSGGGAGKRKPRKPRGGRRPRVSRPPAPPQPPRPPPTILDPFLLTGHEDDHHLLPPTMSTSSSSLLSSSTTSGGRRSSRNPDAMQLRTRAVNKQRGRAQLPQPPPNNRKSASMTMMIGGGILDDENSNEGLVVVTTTNSSSTNHHDHDHDSDRHGPPPPHSLISGLDLSDNSRDGLISSSGGPGGGVFGDEMEAEHHDHHLHHHDLHRHHSNLPPSPFHHRQTPTPTHPSSTDVFMLPDD